MSKKHLLEKARQDPNLNKKPKSEENNPIQDSKKFKFAVFLGRFQPMLTETHFQFCIKESIVDKGLTPIIFIGSPNSPLDNDIENKGKPEIFKPHENPLTYQQRFEIYSKYIKELNPNSVIDFVPDFGDGQMWIEAVCKKTLESLGKFNSKDIKYNLENALFFSIGKSADKNESKQGGIPPLSSFLLDIKNSGFGDIYSPTPNAEMEKISASIYRKISVDSEEFLTNVVGANEIANLAKIARNNHILSALFNEKNLPITMMDLALSRISNEIDNGFSQSFFNQIQTKLTSDEKGEYLVNNLYDDIKNFFDPQIMKSYIEDKKSSSATNSASIKSVNNNQNEI